jgi:hypothetical protein
VQKDRAGNVGGKKGSGSDFDNNGAGLSHAGDAGFEKQSVGGWAVFTVDDIERGIGVGGGEVECSGDEAVLQSEE